MENAQETQCKALEGRNRKQKVQGDTGFLQPAQETAAGPILLPRMHLGHTDTLTFSDCVFCFDNSVPLRLALCSVSLYSGWHRAPLMDDLTSR